MTARCVRVVQNWKKPQFSPTRTYLEKDVSPSVLSSGAALSFELSFERQELMWCIYGIEPAYAPSERMPVQSPFRGASKLPPKPPWPKENFIPPFGIPLTKRAFHSPSGHPRPSVRRLDAVSVSPLNSDHFFTSV